jgi:thioredoxin 1
LILGRIVEDIGDRVRICRVDVDENPRLTQLYQVNGIPTLLLFKNGTLVKRFIGVQNGDVLLKALESIGTKNDN